MGKQHIIELNGKRYDAQTGKMIPAGPVAVNTAKKKPTQGRGISIDGIAKVPVHPKSQRSINVAAAHQAQKSKTLMRTTVAKPKTAKPVTKHASTPAKQIVHASASDQKRLEHAKTVPKSPAISRFSSVVGKAKTSLTPTASPKGSPLSQSAPSKSPTKATVQASAVAPAQSIRSKNIVEKALDDAEITEAPILKKEKRHVRVARKLHLTPRQVSIGGFAIAAVLIVGFFTYQNATNLSMRIASSRAGIHGSLPGYAPAGFHVTGGVAYNPGQITISYKSASDNRNFKIIQNVSEWNSQALMDNYVATNHPNNQTVQDRGKTVYLYDGSNATWVDGGIWYRIEGDSQLNSDQLLNIAASM